KNTLAVRIGRERAVTLYALLVAGAFAVLPIALIAGDSTAWPLIGLLAAPLALKPAKTLEERRDGPALNGVLAQTGALLGVFSLLVTVGLLISA
ncbi:MAG TPA: 1,4-dihydroxy-2-naphthoate polyprenyltransferase, partial [Solirubrobacterales bacterium]